MKLMFLNDSINRASAYQGTYDMSLVVLSYCVACLASFCALTILKNNLSRESSAKAKNMWLAIGAVAMGTGIWAMHFIGMLAFRLPIPIEYNPLITALSVLPAIFASWVVLRLIGGSKLTVSRLVLGGVLMGAGIGLMHYAGMAGMTMNAMMSYDPVLFAGSIGVAVVLSIASLYSTYYLKNHWRHHIVLCQVAGALIMGMAVATMHYTGMAATFFFETGTAVSSVESFDPAVLGILVSIASVVVISLTTLAAVIDYHYRAATRSATTSQTILARVLESTQQGYLYINNDAIAVDLNPAMCRILDRKSEEIIGRPFDEFIDPKNKEVVKDKSQEFQHSEAGHYEVGLLRSDGSIVPCINNVTVILDDEGQRNGSVGLFADITEIKKRERLSETKAEMVMTVLNYLIVGVVLIDENGVIQLFNKVCEFMFGYKSEEVIGKNVSMLLESSCQLKHSEYISSISNSRNGKVLGVGENEIFAVKKNGVEFPIELGVNRITLDGKDMFVEGILDISERKNEQKRREELEQELIQTSKLEAVGQLAGGIAHEINTPIQYIGDNLAFLEEELSGILLALRECQTIANKSESNSVLLESMNSIRTVLDGIDIDYLEDDVPKAISQSISGIKDVAGIVLSMKEFSHPSSKGLSALDLNGAVKNTLTISRNEWKHIAEISLTLDKDLPQVMCIPSGINQVLLNIVVNASHAIVDAGRNGNGKIGIETRNLGENVEIRISDNGVGMSEDIRMKIFDPFFTTKDVGRGTGQGLAIAWDIVAKKHNGSIEVESEEGKGTVFSIRLPIDGKMSQEELVE